MKTKTEMIAEIKTKLADYYSVTEDKVSHVGDYINPNEQKVPDLNLVSSKLIFFVDRGTGEEIRTAPETLKQKNQDAYTWDGAGTVTKQLFTPPPPTPEETIEQYASEWAEAHGAKHCEIAETNTYINTCRMYAYVESGDDVIREEYVIYREGGQTKAKKVV